VAAREGRSEPHEPSTLDLIVLASSTELGVHPADEIVRKSEQSQIARTLAQLPSDYEIVLRLRYYEEWPVQRIATFLSLTVTTVKWRLHHGRELMRRQLNELKRQAEEEINERNNTKPGRDSAPARRLATDHQHGQGSEPYRMSGKRQSQFCATIQPYSASTRRKGR
jgi:hypothetical protein